jgi:hypothetical protein
MKKSHGGLCCLLYWVGIFSVAETDYFEKIQLDRIWGRYR